MTLAHLLKPEVPAPSLLSHPFGDIVHFAGFVTNGAI